MEPPSNVNVTVINSTAVFVSLTPPPQQMVPGVNLGYKVTVGVLYFWVTVAGRMMIVRFSYNFLTIKQHRGHLNFKIGDNFVKFFELDDRIIVKVYCRSKHGAAGSR